MISSELYFVPTPNWFISRPLDISTSPSNDSNGLLALSVIGSIYFLDYKFRQYHFCINNAHLKRINSVVFSKSNSLKSILNIF